MITDAVCLVIGFIVGLGLCQWVIGKSLTRMAEKGWIMPGPQLPIKYKEQVFKRHGEPL